VLLSGEIDCENVVDRASADKAAGCGANDAHTHVAKRIVVSFDIDGTLEVGDPPGPVTIALIRELVAHSVIFGSSSDRTVHDQARMWRSHGLEPHFIVTKGRLKSVKPSYPDRTLVHIGDRFADLLEAENAGAVFIDVASLHADSWRDIEVIMTTIGELADRHLDAPSA
jgi:hypothetical protein